LKNVEELVLKTHRQANGPKGIEIISNLESNYQRIQENKDKKSKDSGFRNNQGS